MFPLNVVEDYAFANGNPKIKEGVRLGRSSSVSCGEWFHRCGVYPGERKVTTSELPVCPHVPLRRLRSYWPESSNQ